MPFYGWQQLKGSYECIQRESIKWHGSINTKIAIFCLTPCADPNICNSAEKSQMQPDAYNIKA